MMARYQRLVTCCCILITVNMSGCDTSSKDTASDQVIEVEEAKEPIEYTMDVVRRGDVTNTVTIDCSYMQMEDEEIAFDVENEVIYQVYVEKGDTVIQGDLLIELNVEELEKTVEELKYTISYQKLLLEQTKDMQEFDLKARRARYDLTISQLEDKEQKTAEDKSLAEDLENIKESYRRTIEDYEDSISIAQYKLDTYQDKIDSSKLYAGMDGTVSYVRENLVGSLTNAEDTLITIIDSSVCAFTSENVEYKEYFKEEELVMIITGFGAKKEEREAYPMLLSEWKGQMYFELAEKDYEMAIGTRGSIEIVLETADDVLYLSKDAIHTAEGQSYVYVVDEEGMRSIQYVEIGLKAPSTVEITSGLQEGDYVILKRN